MARATELFAEEVHVMKALYQDYNRKNDIDNIAATEQDINDICETCTSREADARNAIKELQKQVQELEVGATYPHKEGVHAERVAALRRQIDVAKQLIEELDEESRSVEKQRQMIEAQLQEAHKSAQEAATVMSADEAVTKHQLSLYAHITRVTWRSDQQPLVAGTVSDSATGDIRLFSFDPAATSRFELVNALWELL